jgi:ferric-dicitrate binding protein FerR (iron transport regulator)
MLNRGLPCGRRLFAAALVATALFGAPFARSNFASAAGGGCALVPNERDPSEKMLQCGEQLTIRPAHGTRYRPVYKAGQQLPTAVQLNDGALLIEFHPSVQENAFQILTPLAIAAVRGTKWAMEVSPARTSTLVLDGSVAVTNRRLNEYVVLTEWQGVDITPSDTTMAQKQWGQARIRALLSRFGE